MIYYYDDYGWLTATPNGRSTELVPPTETSSKSANFTGKEWVLVKYVSPVSPVSPVVAAAVNPTLWLIDKGQFLDRFGVNKITVLMSTDSTIKALLVDITNRQWIDLQRADVISALAYIGTVIPAVTPELQAAILTTPVTDIENLAVRKLYFS